MSKEKIPVEYQEKYERKGHKYESEINDVLCTKVATLKISGVNNTQIAKELKVSRELVLVALNHEKTREILRSAAEEVLAKVKTDFKLQMIELLPKALKVISDSLDNGDLKAVPIALKAMGLAEEAEEGNKQAQQLTVVLPGNIPVKRSPK